MPYKFVNTGLTIGGKVRQEGEIVADLPPNLRNLSGDEQMSRFGKVHWVNTKDPVEDTTVYPEANPVEKTIEEMSDNKEEEEEEISDSKEDDKEEEEEEEEKPKKKAAKKTSLAKKDKSKKKKSS